MGSGAPQASGGVPVRAGGGAMIPLRDSVPSRSWPAVSTALIAANVGVFLYELAPGPDLEVFVRTWGFVPARFFLPDTSAPGDWLERGLPLLTSMFLHGGWAHLLGNMVYLWIFGDNVEDHLGHGRYLAFYLLTGVAAALAHASVYPDSAVPTVGASGAISGVLGGYLVLYPRARVIALVPLPLLFFEIVELPATLYLGLWFLMQFLSGALALVLAGEASGVAWWAHVGGFVAGALLARLARRRRSYPRVWPDEYAPW